LLKLKGRIAVVTGAGSGIGRAIAVALSSRGCHLALADIDEAGMAKTAEQIAAQGVRVSQHRLDVSDAGAVAGFPDQVIAQHRGADLLVNNAGVALGGTFEQVAESDFEWLFAINFWGVVRMTRAFLPLLRRSEEGHIVNISSIYGLIAPPGQTAYAASKFAVRGFSMSLRHELQGTGIGITAVHPAGVATSIAKNARVSKGVPAEEVEKRRRIAETLLRMPPETAGEIIVRGVERRKARVLVGTDAKIVSIIERLLPVSYWKLIGRERTL
jgi:NAD(P)-dependent dehydrogenase (short-subunit alcohol dehydrogenase family)